jgi:hypothetical protein
MLARLRVQALLRLTDVAERCPGVRGSAGNLVSAEVPRRDLAVARREIELFRGLFV